MINWKTIEQFVEMIKLGQTLRIEGDGFIVYKVGNIIRIDIKL